MAEKKLKYIDLESYTIISTGIANLEDIELAIKTCLDVGNNQIALLKCTSSYPAPLDEINLNKTGALIKTSLQVGAILSQEKNEIIDFFGELGEKIGLAFQIKDDMFDREKIDELNYFNMIGEKEAIKRLNDLTSEIYFCLDKLDGYDFLKYLVKIILERKN